MAKEIKTASELGISLRTVSDIPEVIGAMYGADALILTEADIAPEFLNLKTGLLGELFQKLVTYRIPTAVIIPDCDAHGERFRAIYLAAREVTTEPVEILERIYVAVAGANFRMDAKRANAAYAVVSYFFDSCHIFETPPATLGSAHAAAN